MSNLTTALVVYYYIGMELSEHELDDLSWSESLREELANGGIYIMDTDT